MRGCIVVHGLTGTPVCVSSIREGLLANGFQVAAPCLAGHGGTLEDLARSKWQDWYETVKTAYGQVRKSAEKVYFAGISLGALLGLKLALDEGWGIRALALMGTPLVLTRLGRMAVPLVRYTPAGLFVRNIAKNFEKSVADPKGRLIYKTVSLPKIPTASVFQLVELQKVILKQLKQITNPILLVHARRDRVAPPGNVEIVRKGVSSDIIETIYLENSEHVITMDLEKNFVAQKVVEFFEKFG